MEMENFELSAEAMSFRVPIVICKQKNENHKDMLLRKFLSFRSIGTVGKTITSTDGKLRTGPEIIKPFSCATQLRMKFVPLKKIKCQQFLLFFPAKQLQNNCWHFNTY